MSPARLPADEWLRHAGPAEIATTWDDARARLLRLWQAYERELPPSMEIRYAVELNPPRWELGHVGWFEEWWIARNPQRLRGTAAEPDVARAAPLLPGADVLYHSSQVAHTRRWHLALPDAARTRCYVGQVHQRTRALLAEAGPDDDALYVFRLALAHELMHTEAWVYMAQHLALPVADALACSGPAPVTAPEDAATAAEIPIDAQVWRLGSEPVGFVFDNELGAHEVELDAFRIDATPVTWARFLPFVEAGGYDDERLWTPEGWAWRQRESHGHPRHLLRDDGRWQRAAFGQWQALNPAEPAMHLTQHEALAWCCWAGRRLPTEAEWECAAMTAPEAFHWGQVWEWTASPFSPYPGFTPHPYRDYSQPWFDGRPVLRGASFATHPAMKHPRYRNYFPPARNDLFAGFRSCAA